MKSKQKTGKIYRVYWECELNGYTDIEAFDEQDAEDQLPAMFHRDELDENTVIYPTVNSSMLIWPKDKKEILEHRKKTRHRAPKKAGKKR